MNTITWPAFHVREDLAAVCQPTFTSFIHDHLNSRHFPAQQTFDMFRWAAPQISLALTASCTLFSTGTYIYYKDWSRNRRMIRAFKQGCVLEPLDCSDKKVKYVRRCQEESRLKEILMSDVSHQYYVVLGEVGVGKTRMLTEIIRGMMTSDNRRIADKPSATVGAPVYVSTSQGRSFPDTFALATGYLFDEHISFRFFLNFVFRVGAMPKGDERNKLHRVLSAIENAGYAYLQETGKPVVIVIDGVDSLPHKMPGALEILQEKAKLWADSNIAKIIFVTNDEATLTLFQANDSAWSRAAAPVIIDDLTDEEARTFLQTEDPFLRGSPDEQRLDYHKGCNIPDELVDKMTDLVGGRIQHLLELKRDWYSGQSFDVTATHLKQKEKNKFQDIPGKNLQIEIIRIMLKSPRKVIYFSQLDSEASVEAMHGLTAANILKYERQSDEGWVITFQSKLTERVAEQLFSA